MGDLVCVTGAAGYVGTFVVQALLERGYRVRATVRDLSNAAKTAHLRGLDVELVEADLLQAGSFVDAVAGARHVVHTASSVVSKSDDPQREIVDPAVLGIRNVLQAARSAGTVERFVHTSSAASIIDGARPDEGHTFTEADWNESATLETAPYDFAKREAEREATRFVQGLPESERFRLTAIHPTMIFGPVPAAHHLSTTPGIIRDLMSGAYPAAPNLTFGIVDVRDVATAHVNALEAPALSLRYLCYAESLSLPEIARRVRALEPRCRAPRWRMPDPVMYIAALFDRRLTVSFLRRNLGRSRAISNELIRAELAMEFRGAQEALQDCVTSLVEGGHVRLRT